MQFSANVASFFSRSSRKAAFLLSLVWILGLLCGCHMGTTYCAMFSSYFYDLRTVPLSFVLRLISSTLPLFLTLSLAAVFRCEASLLIVFCRAFCFSAILSACACVYSSAGWLVCSLMFFSSFLLNPVYLYFWYLLLSKQRLSKQLLFAFFAMHIIVVLVDYSFVSRFLSSLFTI